MTKSEEQNMSSAAPVNRLVWHPCEICATPVFDHTPEYCCNGSDCGCLGRTIYPCVCSKRCGDALYDIDGSFDDRRIRHRIALWDGDVIPPNAAVDRAASAAPIQQLVGLRTENP